MFDKEYLYKIEKDKSIIKYEMLQHMMGYLKGGKLGKKEFHGKDYIVLFVESIITMANEFFNDLHIKKENITKEMYKDYILSIITHEHMHWYQILWMRKIGGSSLVKFITAKEAEKSYKDQIMEIQAFSSENIFLSKYSSNNFKNYDLDKIIYIFNKDFRSYVEEYEKLGNKINYKKGNNLIVKKNPFKNNQTDTLFKTCKNIIQNSKGDPELREQRVNELVEKNYDKILQNENEDNWNSFMLRKKMIKEGKF